MDSSRYSALHYGNLLPDNYNIQLDIHTYKYLDDNLNVRSTKRKLAIEAILNLENRKYFKIESICVCN